jgi:hypothetical protein
MLIAVVMHSCVFQLALSLFLNRMRSTTCFLMFGNVEIKDILGKSIRILTRLIHQGIRVND